MEISLVKAPKKVGKKLRDLYYTVSGRERATGAVQLSLENAHQTYGSYQGVQIHHVLHKNDFSAVPFQTLPEDAVLYDVKFGELSYEAVVLDVTHPGFSFRHNHLLDDRLRVIYEPKVTFEMLPIQHEFLKSCKPIKGTVAYLSNTLSNQYGHWLQCQLPMLLAYWQSVGKDQIDYYYIGDCPIADFVEESLGALGIRKEQIINYPCTADRSLIAIKFRDVDLEHFRTGLELDWTAFQFLREMFKPMPDHEGAYSKRIYVGRGNVKARRVLNESAVTDYLNTQGFASITMEGKTMQQEADIFGNADVIIAPHGSALHNLLFAKPGTKVIEIFPHGYYEPSNYIIANYVGCDYYHVIGDPLLKDADIKRSNLAQLNKLDMQINLDKLKAVCNMAGITSQDASAIAHQ